VDVARTRNLCVIDVGEKIGDVIWDRFRIDLHNRPFAEIEANLFPLLALPQVKRACLDATPSAPIFTSVPENVPAGKSKASTSAPISNNSSPLPSAPHSKTANCASSATTKLRADLRAMRKEVTPSGNIRLDGQADDSHCDRFWAKALRHEAARRRFSAGGLIG